MTFKTKAIIFSAIISFVLIIGLFFYFALRNTSKDVSEKAPYLGILNKKIVTIEDQIHIPNSTLEFTEEYPFELQNPQTIDTSYVKHKKVPKGSILRFKKALEVYRAVSGSRYTFLLGELTITGTNEKLPILYHWGTFKSQCIQEPCDYWEHIKAPWQEKMDTLKYFD